jgi:hypothetical protein
MGPALRTNEDPSATADGSDNTPKNRPEGLRY